MPAAITQSWTVTQATPLGDVRTSWELTPEGLRLRSDAPMGADSQPLRWDAITEAATAVVDLPAQKRGPDMVSWMPSRMEWLLVSRSDGGRSLMHPLPASDVRNGIVAALRERLGNRLVGEQLPLQSAQKRFRISARGDGLKLAAIIGSAFVLLILLLMATAIVGSVLYLPALFAAGAWVFRKGLLGLRDALQSANTPTAQVSSAAMGSSSSRPRHPRAAVTRWRQRLPERVVGCRCRRLVSKARQRWWSLAPGDGAARRKRRLDARGRDWAGACVAARCRSALDGPHLGDWQGRAAGARRRVLDGTAFAWHGSTRLRVRERRMEAERVGWAVGVSAPGTYNGSSVNLRPG